MGWKEGDDVSTDFIDVGNRVRFVLTSLRSQVRAASSEMIHIRSHWDGVWTSLGSTYRSVARLL